jgi:hypothetical protein
VYDLKNLDGDGFITKIHLETRYQGRAPQSQDFIIYPVPETPLVANLADVAILDGGSRDRPFYLNQSHKIETRKFSGGTGNGDGVINPGETIELFIRLPQGVGPLDRDTYHPAFLLNPDEDPYVSVEAPRYNTKSEEWECEANIQSRIKISPDAPPGHRINLWLRLESYNFFDEGYTKPIFRHRYDYRRVVLTVEKFKS